MAIKLTAAVRNAMLNAVTTAAGGSALWRIYNGSQPAGPDTAISTQTVVSTLTCNGTFAPAAASGVLTLNAITQDSSAVGGTATWFRMLTSGATALIDGAVGTSGSDLNLNSTTIGAGAIVQISSATFTAGNA